MGDGVEVISVLFSIGTAALEQAANTGCLLNLAGYFRTFDIIASQQSNLDFKDIRWARQHFSEMLEHEPIYRLALVVQKEHHYVQRSLFNPVIVFPNIVLGLSLQRSLNVSCLLARCGLNLLALATKYSQFAYINCTSQICFLPWR
jgi:hypothetical protein